MKNMQSMIIFDEWASEINTLSKLWIKSSKWVGKCLSCGEWNTFTEEVIK